METVAVPHLTLGTLEGGIRRFHEICLEQLALGEHRAALTHGLEHLARGGRDQAQAHVAVAGSGGSFHHGGRRKLEHRQRGKGKNTVSHVRYLKAKKV